MKTLGWLIMLGGVGWWLWRKFGAAAGASASASPQESSFIFNGQIGSNFYDNSTIGSESSVNNLRYVRGKGGMQYQWEDATGATQTSFTKPTA